MDWRIPLPRIRNINPMPAVHHRQQVYVLQDPFQLAEGSIIIPQELGAIFMLCDGTRTIQAVQSSLISIFGIRVSEADLRELFLAMDESCLFENERYEKAHSDALDAFRRSPFRRAIHAGVSYPTDPEELTKMLAGFQSSGEPPSTDELTRGVITPHIDFARGGSTYANAWTSLLAQLETVELVILLGTDHHGTGEIFTLTRQDYATPFGILPTYQPAVDMMVDIFGEGPLFSGELRHRTEHSIEFAAVWLHYLRDGKPCSLLPILCDDLPTRNDGKVSKPDSDPHLQAAISDLRELIRSKNTLVVAAGDLSHVGPAFGGEKVPAAALGDLNKADQDILAPIAAGEALEFHRTILSTENQTNVCGTSPFVHALNLLDPLQGRLLDYQQCPADPDETSWVSICAMHLY
ncbi:MAG: AmmeMemoRadiSam system protein B [Anaerolineales bacterium]|nr:AmmeMemoRadiSam system protein B [Anaerolineales bacterium]